MKKYIGLLTVVLALTACDQSDKSTEKPQVKTVEQSNDKPVENNTTQPSTETEVKNDN
jgi:hypothetical protein